MMEDSNNPTKSLALDLAVIGGGAAGYFAALRAAELLTLQSPVKKAQIAIFEGGRRPLEKVKISGGGRCNVTHACFDPAQLMKNYPRGAKELRAAFHHFQPRDTVNWFSERRVELKTEADGRMFPVTDSSTTILNCFEQERARLGVMLETGARLEALKSTPAGFFLSLNGGVTVTARFVLLASGSNRAGHDFARKMGHSISTVAPSLFTFVVNEPELQAMAGVSAERVELSLFIEGREISTSTGPLLLTHWGVSGPSVLKISAWAARELLQANYHASLFVNWVAGLQEQVVREVLLTCKLENPRKLLTNTSLFGLSSRLWGFLVARCGLNNIAWNQLSSVALQALIYTLIRCELPVSGKGQFKDEFVTCGGVLLNEVDFKRMQSKITRNLFFAGEILDIDGVTGGFNFQSAWTTGWLAGSAIGEELCQAP